MKMPPRVPHSRACDNKVKHATLSDAQAALTKLVAAGAYRPNLNAYRCPKSPKGDPHFHVGRVRGHTWSR